MATNIEVLRTTGKVELPEGLTFPRTVRVKISGDVDDELLPFDGDAVLRFQHGRLEVSSLTVRQLPDGPPIQGERLRQIHRVLAQTVSHILQPIPLLKPGPGLPLLSVFAGWEDVKSIIKDGPTDDALRLVASAYRLSYVVGDPPARSVQKLLGIPRSTTGRWIMLARKRGFLGPTEERKAGEEV
ncbi:MAG: hypothetical protein H0W97_02075 [Actinobacteria bacterium]|nr:hypothetical protein [Actinomycetota bacterium]